MNLSIRKRFLILHFSTILIPFILLGGVLIYLSFVSLEKRFQYEQSNLTRSVKESIIDTKMNDMALILNELSSDEQLLNLDNDLIHYFMMAKWNYTRKLFPYLSWIYYGKPDNSLYVVPEWESDDQYDLTTRPWYINALSTDEAVWSQPYYEYSNKEIVLTISKKIRDRDGLFVGVLAADIILNELFSDLKFETKGVQRKHLVITKRGKAINFSRKSSEPVDYSGILDWQDLLRSGESWTSVYISDEKYYLFLIPIATLDMHLASLLPASVIMAEIVPHLYFTAFLFIMVMIVVFLSNFMLSRYVFSRVQSLISSMDQVILGNYELDHKIVDRDEFRIIEDQLHVMVNRLADKIDELKTINIQKEKLLSLRTSLIHIFSHNATTPITLLFNSTHELSQTSDNEEMKHLHLAASNLKTLIDNTMAFLKLDEGISPGQQHMMDMEEITRLTINMYKPLAMKKALNIELLSTIELPITGNYFLIKIIIENLVDNAVKYSFRGGTISIILSNTETEACFKIKDSGPGFTKEDIPLMFTRFQKLSANPTGGEISTGLGLYLARELVHYHRGKLNLVNETNQGACFLLSFPLS